MQKPIIKVGIIAGEYSGDRLGAKIISGLKKTHHVELFGVGGPKIIKEGLNSIFDFSELHVMGLIEPLKKYSKLKKLQNKLINLFIDNDIDYFIGIDSPDFNIRIHKILKQRKISKNVQVVSPSVWGWRENRIKNIKRYIDLTMCLFNFEHDYYKNKNLPSVHIGHPFSKLSKEDPELVLKKYNLNPSKKYISILPGSRSSEIKYLLPIYIEFIKIHSVNNVEYEYLIPASDERIFKTIQDLIPNSLPVRISIDSARDFLSISKYSIVTSGTATLEAAILGAHPIICYRTNPINYFIISRMLKIADVGLPNLLLGSRKFPELIQKECTPQQILKAVESIDENHLNSLSENLRTLLIGSEETEYTNAILKL